MTRRPGVWLAAAGSVVAFALAFFLRMRTAYGPLSLSHYPGDWTLLWELWRHGQIAAGIVVEGAMLGAAAAAAPWAILRLSRRRQER